MVAILIYFFIINTIGFFLIGYDKRMAIANQYRISEKTLLSIVFLGGIIGSGLAMLFFKHKTSKTSYLLKFFGIISLQIMILFLVLYYKIF
ncbi:Uncharacterized membrane protein YsdA, DUF1294 family [Flavobacterium psychrophilum DSM 3660]|uniref:DUF1294 domain-containing protein n=1 Tax=Flavobacterium psychrophilum TaxID=96345 RepID=UPI0004F6C87B|nr:DUF1294 domain-containing protein [Flavobacterium psychrophilum]AIN75026.1 hypothetical protein FPG3_12490 [Flavobacterium psychrophilum FPG3]MBF2044468.1 DUF1294 domain-containing protein [Flavobacterium psychrophilum]SCY29820.1 Uncharacterized membrane protein YsdA, DUF1294 family [Flavobacterium psychrophilum DSM 3660] [Flavobacterium psychrophilum DSM 3660 = ATCC 49418]